MKLLEPQEQTVTTKARIRTAACEIFNRQGVHGLTMRAIAKEVGISPTAIYRHYASRDALLHEIWQIGCDDLAEAMSSPITSADSDERMLTLTERYVRWALAQPEIFELMYREAADGLNLLPMGGKDDLEKIKNESVNVMIREIQRAVGKGDWRREDVWQIGVAIWSLSRGVISLHRAGLIDVPRSELPKVARQSTRYLLQGLRASPQSVPEDRGR